VNTDKGATAKGSHFGSIGGQRLNYSIFFKSALEIKFSSERGITTNHNLLSVKRAFDLIKNNQSGEA
jgi:hypothetical protein